MVHNVNTQVEENVKRTRSERVDRNVFAYSERVLYRSERVRDVVRCCHERSF
jgi:hypothetical protein